MSRVVSDNDTAGIFSLVTHTADTAFEKLPSKDKDQRLKADIFNLLDILYQKEGDFKASEVQILESLQIRRELFSPEDLAIVACYNYLGVATDSDLRYDEGNEWLEKSAAIIEDHDEDLYVRLRCQNNLNRSRNRYATEKFDDSETLLNRALTLATSYDG